MDYTGYAKHLGADSEVVQWTQANLLNHLKKNTENQSEIEHIIDYLVSSEAPKRLRKMSYTAAVSGSEVWLKALIKKGNAIAESDASTKVVLDFEDGFKFVQLIGEDAYKREGSLMGHCVASYYGSDTKIYSLRDGKNEPHCTIEQDQQIKGKGNGSINPKYIGYVVEFLESLDMTVSSHEMANLGYYDVSKIKSRLHTDTKYFRDVYVFEDVEILGKDGGVFTDMDLLDIFPLITVMADGSMKILGDGVFTLDLETGE